MLYRIGILLLVLIALGLFWLSKLWAALGVVGTIAVMDAVGFLLIVLINLPASP
jgi:hypothetical protein